MRKDKQQQSSIDIKFQKRIDGGILFHDQINPTMIAICTIFKALSILLYFLLGNYHLTDFVLVLFLCSIDFWATKNLTGRNLCGLRWWIQIDRQNQDQSWVFQSCNPNRQINQINFYCFWGSQILYNLFWVVMVIIHLIIHIIIYISIFWFCLSMFCLIMTTANTLCYFKCRGNHKQKAAQILQKMGMGGTHMIDQQVADVNQLQSQSNKSNEINAYQIED